MPVSTVGAGVYGVGVGGESGVGGVLAVVWGVGARVLPQRLGLVWIRGVGVGVGDGAGGSGVVEAGRGVGAGVGGGGGCGSVAAGGGLPAR